MTACQSHARSATSGVSRSATASVSTLALAPRTKSGAMMSANANATNARTVVPITTGTPMTVHASALRDQRTATVPTTRYLSTGTARLARASARPKSVPTKMTTK